MIYTFPADYEVFAGRVPGGCGAWLFRLAHSPWEALSGSVADQTGAPLPGVRVAIQGVATRTAETGAAGDFAFQDLPEGDYEISAELSGFERAHRAVRVKAGERVTVILTLRVVLDGNRDRHR